MARVLATFVASIFLLSKTFFLESNGQLLKHDGYYCFVMCLAKCLSTNKNFDQCKPGCQQHFNETENHCPPEDANCWNPFCNISDSSNSPSDVLIGPTEVHVSYSNISLSPRKALFEWKKVDKAILYIVEYTESDDELKSFKLGKADRLVTTNTFIEIEKTILCSEYEFRVAAVDITGVGSFSNISKLPKPVPEMNVFNFTLVDSVLQPVPYYDITTPGRPLTNESVRITIEYVPPTGWNVQAGEVEATFQPSFFVGCGDSSSFSFAPPKATISDKKKLLVYFTFPSIVIEKECSFIISLTDMKSKCGSIIKALNQSSVLIVSFNCKTTRNATCAEKKERTEPYCSYAVSHAPDNSDNETLYNGKFVPVTVSWKREDKVKYTGVVRCFLLNITETAKPNRSEPIPMSKEILHKFELKRYCENVSSSSPNHEYQLTINDTFEPMKYYSVQVCAIFDNRTSINWIQMAFQHEIYLPYRNPNAIEYINTKLSTFEWIGVALGIAAFLFLFLVLAIVYKLKCSKAKSIDQFGTPNGVFFGDNHYVEMPRRFDVWELSRKRLIVYENEKLGAGAFGSVFKGKIVGNLLSHKDASSVLAENWMKAEDCDVAVKMLPEFADDSSKSDFRKEINLMKQLGNHERLVNMLACVTADEPFCLIVDFCADGDLLHYLRDRRQYMIRLETTGVDINNLPEVADVDLNMVLCLKDLISFSWQISVGMEYLSQKGFIHRDVAARNILVDKGKKAKIGDFGLCRYSVSDPIYMGKGGRLPLKWMAIEAIKSYEFTTKSDVWSFGVLLFEIITLGGSPYPGIQPSDMQETLEAGKRMEQPDNCPDELYQMMLDTWQAEPDKRPTFSSLRETLRKMLEDITVDYYYMSLNMSRDYYNVVYGEDQEKKASAGLIERPDVNSDCVLTAGTSSSCLSLVNETSDSDIGSEPSPVLKPPVVPRSSRQQSCDSGVSSMNTDDTGVRTAKISSNRSSSSSEQSLVTPLPANQLKFFKFKPSTLPDLPEAANSNGSSSYSSDSSANPICKGRGIENPSNKSRESLGIENPHYKSREELNSASTTPYINQGYINSALNTIE